MIFSLILGRAPFMVPSGRAPFMVPSGRALFTLLEIPPREFLTSISNGVYSADAVTLPRPETGTGSGRGDRPKMTLTPFFLKYRILSLLAKLPPGD